MADQVKKNKKSMKAIYESFTIRMKLLWIWLLKNASILLKTALIIILILVFINAIQVPELLTLLGVDKEEIQSVDWNNIQSVENIIASLGSAFFSILIILKKTKSLAIEDIKSRELKIALIKAKLYFNENGKLCKRLEESTQLDIDGDGKVGDKEISTITEENLITGLPRAIGELATIVTAKIETEEEPATVVEESELNEDIAIPDTTVTEKLYTEELGAPTEDENNVTEETTTEENVEESKTSKKKSKTKKKFFLFSFIAEIFRALKLSFKNPALNDGMEGTKAAKTENKKKQTTKQIKQDNIEIVNEEETIITTNIQNEVNQIINPTTTTNTTVDPTTVPIAQETVKSAKAKQIDDILNSI